MKRCIVASFCGLFVGLAEAAGVMGINRSAMGSAEKVCFAGGTETHFENRTRRVVGDEAEGEDFRIVVNPGCAGDTAWRSVSLPLAVPAGAKFVSCDFVRVERQVCIASRGKVKKFCMEARSKRNRE